MTYIFVAYFVLALATLGGLTWMLLQIGTMLGACPITGGAARSAAITIATGFAAIGLGGVCLLAALLTVLPDNANAALFASLGLACLALGLGFTQAAATLRAVIAEIQSRLSESANAA